MHSPYTLPVPIPSGPSHMHHTPTLPAGPTCALRPIDSATALTSSLLTSVSSPSRLRAFLARSSEKLRAGRRGPR